MNRILITLMLVAMLVSGATAQTITPTGLNQGDLVALLQNIVNALGSGVGSTYITASPASAPATLALTGSSAINLNIGTEVKAVINSSGSMTIGSTDLSLFGVRGLVVSAGDHRGIVNYRDSSALGTLMGYRFNAKDSAGNQVSSYAAITGKIVDNTTSSPSGSIAISTMNNGTLTDAFLIDDSQEVFFPALSATTATAANVVLEGSPLQLKVSLSSRRYKKDIESLSMDWNKFMMMNPVSFRPIEKPADSQKYFGFIAEDVEPLYPELVGMKDGQPESVHYGHITALNTEAIQGLKRENDELRITLADVVRRLELLEAE